MIFTFAIARAVVIIARAAIKRSRGCFFYCIAFCGYYTANSLKLHALPHADTPSEDFNIHCMKTRTGSSYYHLDYNQTKVASYSYNKN